MSRTRPHQSENTSPVCCLQLGLNLPPKHPWQSLLLPAVYRHLFVLFQSCILTEQKHPAPNFHQSNQHYIRFPSWQGLEFCNLLLTINSNDDKSSSYKANLEIWFCKAMAVLTQLSASTQLSATELGSWVCPQLISQLALVHWGKMCQSELIHSKGIQALEGRGQL